MKTISHSEAETAVLAARVAQTLKGGDCLALIGELGAGKTAFTKGIAKALKLKQNLSSPTFSLMKVYKLRHNELRYLVHVDAYRIENAVALTAIGFEDYIDNPEAVVIIEWADRVMEILPKNARMIYFKHGINQQRIIEMKKL